MTTLVVVSGGADATTELLVGAARSLGIEVELVDLRSHQLSVRVDCGEAAVVSGGRPLSPTVVVNTTSVNGLGLAGPDALVRQSSRRWRHRHSAAREEQGLLLAAFRLWQRQGSLLVNAPEAHDLSLMPNVVVERLDRMGISVNRRAAGAPHTEILLAGERVIAHLGSAPGPRHTAMAKATATTAGFQLGSVGIVRRPSGREVVARWSHRPDLLRWPDHETCSRKILRAFPNLTPNRPAGRNDVFFVSDLGQA